MDAILSYIQILLSVILITIILMQQTDASLGAVFGGGDSGGTGRTRRGFDKTLFNATIVIAVLFAAVSFLSFLL